MSMGFAYGDSGAALNSHDSTTQSHRSVSPLSLALRVDRPGCSHSVHLGEVPPCASHFQLSSQREGRGWGWRGAGAGGVAMLKHGFPKPLSVKA